MTDDDLPGMWSRSDYEGGETDHEPTIAELRVQVRDLQADLDACRRSAAREDKRRTMRGEHSTCRVLDEVLIERGRQDSLWGEQNHPDVPGRFARAEHERSANQWKNLNRVRTAPKPKDNPFGGLAWDGILLEEVYEALAESDPAKLRAELVQVAAVAVCWCEAIDRRSPK